MAFHCGMTSSLSARLDPAGINLCCCADLSCLGRLPRCGLGVGFLACSQHRWDEEVRVSWYKRFSKETSCCDQSLACVCALPWAACHDGVTQRWPGRVGREHPRRGSWGSGGRADAVHELPGELVLVRVTAAVSQ